MFTETNVVTIKVPKLYNFFETCKFACSSKSEYSLDKFKDGIYSRVLRIDNKICLVKAELDPHNDVIVTVKGENLDVSHFKGFLKIISRIIGIDQNPEDFYKMAALDPLLEPLLCRYQGLHIPQSETIFEALILSILGQQISTHVASMLRKEIIVNYGEQLKIDGSVQYAFPTPKVLSQATVEELKTHKLSGRKAEYIQQIAMMESEGTIDLESFRGLSADKATKKLIDLKGVGNWTANWLLVRALSHQDGFPYGDLALQKYMGNLILKRLIMSDKDALTYSERWSPHRSWVTTYMFADLRNQLNT